MDMADKHPGLTHVAFTVKSLDETKAYLKENNIELTGSFNFGGMSAVFVRDPDRNVIELDAYNNNDELDMSGYSSHL
jgi:catechol 2,3-dioxygenase-like lactoylglutathione lyase family enzyme